MGILEGKAQFLVNSTPWQTAHLRLTQIFKLFVVEKSILTRSQITDIFPVFREGWGLMRVLLGVNFNKYVKGLLPCLDV